MSGKRRVKSWREKRAEQLNQAQKEAGKAIGMAAVLDALERYRERGRAEQLALSDGGAQPNNMAPPKYGLDGSTVVPLHRGIDSIWLNVSGTLKEDWQECLAMAKEDAQAAAGDWALSPLPPYDGTTPLMHAAGVKFYEWHCKSNDVDVQIRKPGRSPRPAAIVRVLSEALWRLGDGGKAAVRLVEDWLRPLFDVEGYRVTVSRAHLATDFQGWVPVLADLENVVKRAGDEHYFADGEGDEAVYRDRARRLTGVAAGRSANGLRLNTYDKVAEIRKSGKTWFRDLWARCKGYRDELQTWRVEMQFGREFLRERGIETIADLFAAMESLWAYAMGWYSFRVPDEADSNRSRWAVAGFWQELARWSVEDAGELPKVKQVRPKLQRMAAGFVGYLTSVMALTDKDSPREALEAAIDVVCAAEVTQPGLDWSQEGTRLAVKRAGERVIGERLREKKLRYAGFTMAG